MHSIILHPHHALTMIHSTTSTHLTSASHHALTTSGHILYTNLLTSFPYFGLRSRCSPYVQMTYDPNPSSNAFYDRALNAFFSWWFSCLLTFEWFLLLFSDLVSSQCFLLFLAFHRVDGVPLLYSSAHAVSDNNNTLLHRIQTQATYSLIEYMMHLSDRVG